MRNRLLAAMVLSALLVVTGACGSDDDEEGAADDTSATTAPAQPGGDHSEVTMKLDLKGGEEVPPGDPDGSGTADLRFDQNKNEVCYDIKVSNIGPPTASHIHKAPKGQAWPPVVTLEAAKIGQGEACVPTPHETIDEIVEKPDQFYVNVHTDEFKTGAVRAQLSKQ